MFNDGARAAVAKALLEGERFVVVTHENPDGDALGSLVAATKMLQSIGKDVVALVGQGDLPISDDYRRLTSSLLETAIPADVGYRTALVLDCGNADRVAVPQVLTMAAMVVNVDHHHDNTGFGHINYLDAVASSTAEILWTLAPDIGAVLNREIAEALYFGLVTDTGRFMYQNTTGRSHLMAADLHGLGAATNDVYRELYEQVQWPKIGLLGRALSHARLLDGGQIVFTFLSLRDFAECQADSTHAEGVIDVIRAVAGPQLAAFAREVTDENGQTKTKVSLRAINPTFDVSAIARAGGGGGHPQAAGFTSSLSEAGIADFLSQRLAGTYQQPVDSQRRSEPVVEGETFADSFAQDPSSVQMPASAQTNQLTQAELSYGSQTQPITHPGINTVPENPSIAEIASWRPGDPFPNSGSNAFVSSEASYQQVPLEQLQAQQQGLQQTGTPTHHPAQATSAAPMTQQPQQFAPAAAQPAAQDPRTVGYDGQDFRQPFHEPAGFVPGAPPAGAFKKATPQAGFTQATFSADHGQQPLDVNYVEGPGQQMFTEYDQVVPEQLQESRFADAAEWSAAGQGQPVQGQHLPAAHPKKKSSVFSRRRLF